MNDYDLKKRVENIEITLSAYKYAMVLAIVLGFLYLLIVMSYDAGVKEGQSPLNCFQENLKYDVSITTMYLLGQQEATGEENVDLDAIEIEVGTINKWLRTCGGEK